MISQKCAFNSQHPQTTGRGCPFLIWISCSRPFKCLNSSPSLEPNLCSTWIRESANMARDFIEVIIIYENIRIRKIHVQGNVNYHWFCKWFISLGLWSASFDVYMLIFRFMKWFLSATAWWLLENLLVARRKPIRFWLILWPTFNNQAWWMNSKFIIELSIQKPSPWVSSMGSLTPSLTSGLTVGVDDGCMYTNVRIVAQQYFSFPDNRRE